MTNVSCPFCGHEFSQQLDQPEALSMRRDGECRFNCKRCNSRIGVRFRLLRKGASVAAKREKIAREAAAEAAKAKLQAEPGCDCSIMNVPGGPHRHFASCASRKVQP